MRIEAALSQALPVAAANAASIPADVQKRHALQMLYSLAVMLAAQIHSPLPALDSNTADTMQTGQMQHELALQLIGNAMQQHQQADGLKPSNQKQHRTGTDSAYDSAEEDCHASMGSGMTCNIATQTDAALQPNSGKHNGISKHQCSNSEWSHSSTRVSKCAGPGEKPNKFLRQRAIRFMDAQHRFL